MNLSKVGAKFFFEDSECTELPEFIPVFHRWIQDHTVDGLLIDVADYSHVHAGPGVLLVGHEGNYAVDETGNRRGLVYYSKNAVADPLSQQLKFVCQRALIACARLVQEPELQGRVKFRGDELQLFANDRLNAPNTDETLATFRPSLTELLENLYPDVGYFVSREVDSRERFAVWVKASESVELDTLAAHLG